MSKKDLTICEQSDRDLIKQINTMSHVELCRRWRYDPVNNPLFEGVVGARFEERLFVECDGFTFAINKQIEKEHYGS